MNLLLNLASASSMFTGPNKIGKPSDNIFDKAAMEFDLPLVADAFGATAVEKRQEKEQANTAKRDELKQATGIDIFEAVEMPKLDLTPDVSGDEIVSAILSGKDPANLFGGI